MEFSTPALKTSYSQKKETDRIKYTLGKLPWYKEQGYKIVFPAAIEKKLKQGAEITEDDVSAAVAEEFKAEEYEEKEKALLEKWAKRGETFIAKLRTLSLPLQPEYVVSYTQYGVGGSYGVPKWIQINFAYGSIYSEAETVFHEIIHLTIEKLIQMHKIDHWTKERLVDLTLGKFFPEWARLQRDPKNAKGIKEIFDSNFPHMETIISKVAAL